MCTWAAPRTVDVSRFRVGRTAAAVTSERLSAMPLARGSETRGASRSEGIGAAQTGQRQRARDVASSLRRTHARQKRCAHGSATGLTHVSWSSAEGGGGDGGV